jgi:hypothetical protein
MTLLALVSVSPVDSTFAAAPPAIYCINTWGVGTTTEITFLDVDGNPIGSTNWVEAYPNGARANLCVRIPDNAVWVRYEIIGLNGRGVGPDDILVKNSFRRTWNSGHAGGQGGPRGHRRGS